MRTLIVVVALVAWCSGGAVAQEWSAAEQEVWQMIQSCQEAFANEDEGVFECFHEDFVGWWYPDLVPRTADAERKFSRLRFETTEIRGYDLRPIAIRVHGDFAIAHYYLEQIVRGQDGMDVEERVRWTDVLARENGRWQWIGDHGGPIAVTNP